MKDAVIVYSKTHANTVLFPAININLFFKRVLFCLNPILLFVFFCSYVEE